MWARMFSRPQGNHRITHSRTSWVRNQPAGREGSLSAVHPYLEIAFVAERLHESFEMSVPARSRAAGVTSGKLVALQYVLWATLLSLPCVHSS